MDSMQSQSWRVVFRGGMNRSGMLWEGMVSCIVWLVRLEGGERNGMR